MRFDVGQSVRVRDRLWRVQDVKGEQRATLLHLESIDPEAPAPPMWIVTPPDEVEIVDPSKLAWPREGLGRLAAWQSLHMAYELSMNYGPGTLMSLLTSRVRVEPYQLEPVMTALDMGTPRLLIADDVGLGKTVEAGLIMMELIARGLGDNILIVTPSGLKHQWQAEMRTKFGLHFDVYDLEEIKEVSRKLPRGANPWTYRPRIITSIDFVKRDGYGGIRRYLEERRWDLVIVDEGHYLIPTTSKTGLKPNDRSRFGEVLARNTRSLLLLSATPHNGHATSLASLMKLLDPTIPERLLDELAQIEPPREAEKRLKDAVKRHVVRRLKYDVVRENPDGTRSPFPKPTTVILDLGAMPPVAKRAYDALLAYADANWLKADTQLEQAAPGQRGELLALEFAMSILKRRFLSSPRAFLLSVRHRRERLSTAPVTVDAHRGMLREFNEGIPQDENEQESIERELLTAPVSTTTAGRAGELDELAKLERLAQDLVDSGEDPKLRRLVSTLQGQDPEFTLAPDERVIVFTEYRATLEYVRDALEGTEDEPGPLRGRVAVLHGGINTQSGRDAAFDFFGQPTTRVLLATDAVREGFNLQDHANKILHLETPWNPNRLEQRNGRVDRWGQRKPVSLGLFHTPDSYESHILKLMVERIAAIRDQLGSCSDFLSTLEVRGLERSLMTGAPSAQRGPRQKTLFGEDVLKEAEDAMERWRQRSLLIATPFSDDDHRKYSQRARDSRDILPEFEDVHRLYEVALSNGGRLEPLDPENKTWRIHIPQDFRAATQGAATIERCTFDRETAVDDPSLVFITPIHPLTRALIQNERAKVYQGSGEGRTSYRVTPHKGASGYLFTFMARVHNTRHHVVKDFLLPILVKENLVVSRDAKADRALYAAPGVPKNLDRHVIDEFRDEFDDALEHSRAEARDRFRWEYKELLDTMSKRREGILEGLDKALEQERKVFHEKYDTKQKRLDEEGQRLEQKERKNLDKFEADLRARRDLLNDMWTPAPIENVTLVPVGCLLLIPEDRT